MSKKYTINKLKKIWERKSDEDKKRYGNSFEVFKDFFKHAAK